MPKGKYDRKKSFAKKNANKEPELLKLDELTLLKLEKLSNQIRAIGGELILAANMKMNYVAKIDPEQNILKFDQKLEALKTEKKTADEQYMALTKATSAKLGINLADYAYDDETGVLRKVKE